MRVSGNVIMYRLIGWNIQDADKSIPKDFFLHFSAIAWNFKVKFRPHIRKHPMRT